MNSAEQTSAFVLQWLCESKATVIRLWEERDRIKGHDPLNVAFSIGEHRRTAGYDAQFVVIEPNGKESVPYLSMSDIPDDNTYDPASDIRLILVKRHEN